MSQLLILAGRLHGKRAPWFCFAVCVCLSTSHAEEFALESIAGTGAAENNGDAGQAREINIGDPFGVEIGPDGALYVTEVRHHRVRRLDLASRSITTVAGNGRRGYSGDGGPAVNAELNEPYEVRFDSDGNMYFVEMQNHLVRRVDAKTNTISTVAGTGRRGFGGDGGPAVDCLLNQPHSIALDGKGSIYVADIGNHRIRRVDLATGAIESIAGSSERRLPQDGQLARGNPILGPRALCIEGENLWIALREGHSVWRLNLSDGVLHHVAGTGEAGFAGDGGPARQATFNGPKGIAFGPHKGLFVADTENHVIRKIDQRLGIVATIAGGGAQLQMNRPHGICLGQDGALYIGDTLNHLVRRVQNADAAESR
jgi:DNA-binding beta-propeller fold protein YncE